jgi:PPM family protein phosphatase
VTVLRSGSASDVGRVRTVNEDLALETVTLFAVADGMGGHAGGEIASRLAGDSLVGSFRRDPSSDGLIAAVREANEVVYDRSLHDPDLRGMGTTLTAAALVATDAGDRLALANVGDSRAYRFGPGGLEQLTTDHSVAEELVARGELSEAEAAVHPHRHILTRALGVAPEVDVDAWEVNPEEGERYLLCSDGLTNEVSPDRITNVLSSTRDPKAAAQTLVLMANEHGGNDNITVVVVDVVVGDDDGRSNATAKGARGAVVGSARPRAASDGDGPGVSAPGESPPTDGPPVDDAAGSASGRQGARSTSTTGTRPEGTGVAVATALRGAPAGAVTGNRPIGPAGPPVRSPIDPGTTGPAPKRRWRRRRGQRRITILSVLFVVVVAAVGYGAYALVNWYGNNSYFVGVEHGQLVVFKGRIGGFLWTHPEVVRRTGVTTADIPQQYLDDLHQGVEESSSKAALHYVYGLRSIQRSLQPGTTTTTTMVTTTTVTATTSIPGATVGAPMSPIGAGAPTGGL